MEEEEEEVYIFCCCVLFLNICLLVVVNQVSLSGFLVSGWHSNPKMGREREEEIMKW